MRELADRWILPVKDFTVSRCCVDHAFSIELTSGSSCDAAIRIGSEFEYFDSEGRDWRLRPELGAVSLAPALRMFGLEIRLAEAHKDGTLDVAFNDGSRLHVAPDPAYEAWTYAGARGAKVVSLPGGDVAIWRPAA